MYTFQASLSHTLTWAHASSHLDKKFVWRLDDTKCCRNTRRHTDHTQYIADTRRRLRWQASKCADAAQRRSKICHLMDVWIQSRLRGIAIATEECSCRKCIQVAILRWISCRHHTWRLTNRLVSELILNGKSAQLGYTGTFMLIHAGKYRTEDKFKRRHYKN